MHQFQELFESRIAALVLQRLSVVFPYLMVNCVVDILFTNQRLIKDKNDLFTKIVCYT